MNGESRKVQKGYLRGVSVTWLGIGCIQEQQVNPLVAKSCMLCHFAAPSQVAGVKYRLHIDLPIIILAFENACSFCHSAFYILASDRNSALAS